MAYEIVGRHLSTLPDGPFKIRVIDAEGNWNWVNKGVAFDKANDHKKHCPENEYIVIERATRNDPPNIVYIATGETPIAT